MPGKRLERTPLRYVPQIKVVRRGQAAHFKTSDRVVRPRGVAIDFLIFAGVGFLTSAARTGQTLKEFLHVALCDLTAIAARHS